MRTAIMLVIAASLSVAQERGSARGQERKAPARQSEARSRAATTTLTGIIDQTNGKWVISDENSLTPIAALRSSGFKDTNFGRYVGMRVHIRGRMTQEGTEKIFIVSRLSDISTAEPSNGKEPPADTVREKR